MLSRSQQVNHRCRFSCKVGVKMAKQGKLRQDLVEIELEIAVERIHVSVFLLIEGISYDQT